MSAILEDAMTLVSVTPAAVAQLKRLVAKRGEDGLLVRLGVKGGGCSGLSYTMGFTSETTERDQYYEVDGLKIVVDGKAARFLEGAMLDYSIKNLLEGGWVWTNPNAAKSCGCGTSFTPKG
jgi:iron-sulfur cluster assembly protein